MLHASFHYKGLTLSRADALLWAKPHISRAICPSWPPHNRRVIPVEWSRCPPIRPVRSWV